MCSLMAVGVVEAHVVSVPFRACVKEASPPTGSWLSAPAYKYDIAAWWFGMPLISREGLMRCESRWRAGDFREHRQFAIAADLSGKGSRAGESAQ